MPKNFVGEPFSDVTQKVSDSEKVYGLERGGEYLVSPSKTFCPTVPKISVRESFSVLLFSGI